ncbi:hypothetical protein [Deinococcus sp. QL22]|uniref:hypothetical protein n=1 Tax=Deinococcus sp. QL22 TaxID=2939437 RepID=UPI002016E4FB|nr:hypothetical protein [Deinococcus sp. QL22]UQN06256.1 hypothetical protein M1R55_15570 [Deinococcus sp. QL22]
MHPPDLTPVEIADLLDAAYRQDRGLTHDGPDLTVRLELADYLGCHPEVQSETWNVWQELMGDEEGDVLEDDAAFWLDVEFVEPCPDS